MATLTAHNCSKGLEDCSNKDDALHLKVAAIAPILFAFVLGVCMPLLGRSHKAFKAESFLFFVAKSFAAGVILATGLVHVLPDAFDALISTCLPPEAPWRKFPFVGFVAMMAALFTLMIDFWRAAYYEGKHAHGSDEVASHEVTHKVHEENGEGLYVATVYTHSTSQAHVQSKSMHLDVFNQVKSHSHPHSGGIEETSQVLELGVVAHSVIIGISLGTSESPCTIKPLIIVSSIL